MTPTSLLLANLVNPTLAATAARAGGGTAESSGPAFARALSDAREAADRAPRPPEVAPTLAREGTRGERVAERNERSERSTERTPERTTESTTERTAERSDPPRPAQREEGAARGDGRRGERGTEASSGSARSADTPRRAAASSRRDGTAGDAHAAGTRAGRGRSAAVDGDGSAPGPARGLQDADSTGSADPIDGEGSTAGPADATAGACAALPQCAGATAPSPALPGTPGMPDAEAGSAGAAVAGAPGATGELTAARVSAEGAAAGLLPREGLDLSTRGRGASTAPGRAGDDRTGAVDAAALGLRFTGNEAAGTGMVAAIAENGRVPAGEGALRAVSALSATDHLPPGALAGALGTVQAAAAADAAMPEARLAATPGSEAFARELGAQLSIFVREGVQQARLHLNPQELGPVLVRIQLEGAAAQVHMAAELQPTRQALEQALPALAGQLSEAGITLTGGGVFERPPQGFGAGEGDSGGPTSRGDPSGQRDGGAGTAAAGTAAAATPPGWSRPRGIVDLIA
ncbi:MAG: flagellar hook-length control protein FliK [Burkholderiales bacterium]|nr:flagellar hook-length control protein FliK [Burkholderiales bacterium]